DALPIYPRRVRMLAVRRPLDVFRKRRLGSVAAGVAFREHLLHEAEAVVTNQRAAARMTAHLEQAPAESVEVATRERDVLARVIAVPLDESRHLRLAAAVDALDEGDAEFAVIDAPELHAAVRIVRTDVVDAGHERAALDLDVEPRPLLDRAFRACVRHVVDSVELRHRSFSFRVIRLASARTRRARSRCG